MFADISSEVGWTEPNRWKKIKYEPLVLGEWVYLRYILRRAIEISLKAKIVLRSTVTSDGIAIHPSIGLCVPFITASAQQSNRKVFPKLYIFTISMKNIVNVLTQLLVAQPNKNETHPRINK